MAQPDYVLIATGNIGWHPKLEITVLARDDENAINEAAKIVKALAPARYSHFTLYATPADAAHRRVCTLTAETQTTVDWKL